MSQLNYYYEERKKMKQDRNFVKFLLEEKNQIYKEDVKDNISQIEKDILQLEAELKNFVENDRQLRSKREELEKD